MSDLEGSSEHAAVTTAHGNPERNVAGIPATVSITGESEVKVTADRAKVTLKVSTESKSMVEALRSNQGMRAKVAALLKEGGIGPDQIQAARFSSTQKYGVFSEMAKSHVVENFLKIIVRDEREFQSVAGAVTAGPRSIFSASSLSTPTRKR